MLEDAKAGKYAIGAFNTVNLETTKAIIEAASELSSPVIVQLTEKTFDYAGGRAIYHLIKNIAEFYDEYISYQLKNSFNERHFKLFEKLKEKLEFFLKSYGAADAVTRDRMVNCTSEPGGHENDLIKKKEIDRLSSPELKKAAEDYNSRIWKIIKET